ncbi:phospholipase D family protein [Archangium sp.]|uniref:phospholipase D family protein n=1 Tax=Archangium sp. TaxID=1872627 RepID=UPI003899E342
MGAKIHASWVDGEAFSDIWEPLREADEFVVLSCYVSPTGWARIESFVRQRSLENSQFQATLIFSLSGMRENESETLISSMAKLAGDIRIGKQVHTYVMKDDSSALFHPKAHGSSAGGKTRVVVGSANLTAGGMDRNYELMTVLDDFPDSYGHPFQGRIAGGFLDSSDRGMSARE